MQVENSMEPASNDTGSSSNSNSDSVPSPSNVSKVEVSDDFEREPVPEHAFKSNASFAAVFAGRHTAAPELVIGPTFVIGGASVAAMFGGLVIGNLLAVLSWRFVCAPVAMKNRYSTYYQVELICGKKVLCLYNIIVGLTLAIIAGGMFTIAGTAIGVGFGSQAPAGAVVVPTFGLAAIIVATGLCTTTVSIFGYSTVTKVSNVLTPPMFVVFIYMVYRAMTVLGVEGLHNFWEVTTSKVYTGIAEEGHAKLGFLDMVLIACFQDQFCHLGMVDLTLFRFAKSADVGWMSAWGMFPGHYFLWAGAGFLYKAQVHLSGSNDILPGPMAFALAGWPGLLAVLFAGWSTANPFLYASGLAFKSALEAVGVAGVDTRKVTGIVGVIATMTSLFPIIIYQFLNFLGTAGGIITPMGAIIFVHVWVVPRMPAQLPQNSSTNVPALVAWALASTVAVSLIVGNVLPFYFVPFFGIPIAVVSYLGVYWIMARRSDVRDVQKDNADAQV